MRDDGALYTQVPQGVQDAQYREQMAQLLERAALHDQAELVAAIATVDPDGLALVLNRLDVVVAYRTDRQPA